MDSNIFTLILAAALFNALEAVGILALWSYNRHASGLLCWTVSLLLKAIALPILALATGGQLPVLTLAVANAMIVGGATLFYVGNALFLRIAVRWWKLVGFLAVYYLVYLVLLLGVPDLGIRIVWVSAVLSLLYGVSGWLLVFRSSREIRPVATVMGCIFFIASLAHLVRIGEVIIFGPPPSILDPSLAAYTAVVGSIIALALWTFGSYLMVNERKGAALAAAHAHQIAEERRKADAALTAEELRMHNERKELLADMHNGMGAMMANLTFLASLARQEDSPEARRASLEQLEFLTLEMSLELKSVLNVLENTEMRWSDLIAALRQFTDRTARERRVWLHWQVSAHPLPERVGASSAAFLFQRLVKELLAQAVTTCEGGNVNIRWRFGSSRLVIAMRSSDCESTGVQATVTASGAEPADLGARMIRRELSGRRKFAVSYLIFPLPLVIREVANG